MWTSAGEVAAQSLQALLGRTDLGGVEAPDGEAEIGFRPESVRFTETGVACHVERAVYRGAFTRYHLRVGDRQIVADTNDAPQACIRVTDAWRMED